MNKKFFFFDIDGTLAVGTPGRQYIPESTKKAIRLLKEQGHFVAIATGRSYAMAVDHMRSLGFENMVSDGGNGITINNELITIKPLDYQNIAGIGFTAQINNKKYYLGNQKILKKLKLTNTYQEKESYLSKRADSIIYVIENQQIIGLIGVKDILRENAKEVISLLKQMNKKVIMLTGDNQVTASIIAKNLELDEIIADVMPKEKEKYIQNLKKQGKVMMIGDGINDAPSLVRADVGISISSATDIASNAADVILMNDNLLNIINLFIISKKTIFNIKENLFWAFLYNICMIPIAIGITPIQMNPMLASAAMTMSSFTVIINALRLKKISFYQKKKTNTNGGK